MPKVAACRVPAVQLEGGHGAPPPDLRTLVSAFPITVLYFYPGTSASPDHGAETPLVDAAQHLGFNRHLDDFVARNFQVVGISSQSTAEQRLSVEAHDLRHSLLSDPQLLLADRLGLPTYEFAGERWFRRSTLLLSHGIVAMSFHPAAGGSACVQEVLAWLRAEHLWSPAP